MRHYVCQHSTLPPGVMLPLLRTYAVHAPVAGSFLYCRHVFGKEALIAMGNSNAEDQIVSTDPTNILIRSLKMRQIADSQNKSRAQQKSKATAGNKR